MKILFASILPVKDFSSWSGIPSTLFNLLSKSHLTDYCYSTKAHGLQKKIALASRWLKPISKKNLNIYFNQKVARIYADELKIKALVFKPDLIICLGSGTELAYYKTEITSILLTDANFQLLCQNYPIYSNLSSKAIQESYALEQLAYENFTYIYFTSNWALRSSQNQYPELRNKFLLTNFGSNLSSANTSNVSIPKAPSQIRLLAFGHDAKRKGIEKCTRLQKQLNCKLEVVGLNKKLDKSDPNDLSTLINHYKESHFLLVFSSADCTPIVINEANRFGLPVIAFPTGGIPEMIVNGTNGYIVTTIEEAKERIADLLSSNEHYQMLRKSSKTFYEQNLSWNHFIAAINSYTSS